MAAGFNIWPSTVESLNASARVATVQASRHMPQSGTLTLKPGFTRGSVVVEEEDLRDRGGRDIVALRRTYPHTCTHAHTHEMFHTQIELWYNVQAAYPFAGNQILCFPVEGRYPCPTGGRRKAAHYKHTARTEILVQYYTYI